jgi:hypothetical protein
MDTTETYQEHDVNSGDSIRAADIVIARMADGDR